MILVKRLKFLPNLFLFQKGLDMMLMMLYIAKKSNFKTTKMSLYKIVKIFSFSKGLTVDFGQKVEISSEFVSLSKRPWYDVDDVLDREEVFLDHKIVPLRIIKNLHLLGVNPWLWSKTWTFFPICFSFKRALIWCLMVF